MISTSGRKILMQFVSEVKTLLTNNVIATLQQHYGIWADERVIPVGQLTTNDANVVYRARMLRGRLQYIKNSLPADSANVDAKAVQQLSAEQAFTILNRFCAVRMCEERELVMPSIAKGYDSAGFESYDMVTGQGSGISNPYSMNFPSNFPLYSTAIRLMVSSGRMRQPSLGCLNSSMMPTLQHSMMNKRVRPSIFGVRTRP